MNTGGEKYSNARPAHRKGNKKLIAATVKRRKGVKGLRRYVTIRIRGGRGKGPKEVGKRMRGSVRTGVFLVALDGGR